MKGCIADAYPLQILFVYFLTVSSLLHPSILLFFILALHVYVRAGAVFRLWWLAGLVYHVI